jgi:hypothetical protein
MSAMEMQVLGTLSTLSIQMKVRLKVPLAMHILNSEWILDSGAFKHVAGSIGELESYKPASPMNQKTIQTSPANQRN